VFKHALTLAASAVLALTIGFSASTAAAELAQAGPPAPLLRLPARLAQREVAVPILMYHRINVAPPGSSEMERRLTVHQADFVR
jgi:hypothetical protein